MRKGRYRPGDRLPSLRALSQTYASALETINKALRVLADEKLIQSQSTRGTFVLRQPDNAVAGPPGIEALSEELQRLAERVEAAEGQAEAIAELREKISRLEAQVIDLYHSNGRTYSGGEGAGEQGRRHRRTGSD
jgi:DNA-binding GntR family transcriptional regulator